MEMNLSKIAVSGSCTAPVRLEPGKSRFTFLGMTAVICSIPMQRLMLLVEKLAKSSAAVLIYGESGTGKELIARALHEYSPRAGKPWIDVNCAALPDHLVESELFGYERGAFSGADATKQGMFELANQGTLFLDEIGELSLKSQSKLLRVLDGYPHYRLGGTHKIDVNVRIIAASNMNLEEGVRAGRFRADLFHRLNQMRVAVPPLRERPEDVGPLLRFFLQQADPDATISDDAIAVLEGQPWPGNVRELRNLVAQLAVMNEGSEILPEDLPSEYQAVAGEAPETCSLDRIEREVILHALDQAEGRRSHAAELLGISRRTLIRRLKTYGVSHARLHAPAPRCS
jgi:DNA-binding NtrC family response regulator